MEFAVIAPTFLTLLCGIIDSGQAVYAKGVLNGAVQKAARSSALETANTTVADEMVRSAVADVLPGVVVTSTRTSYYDFEDIGRQEVFNDSNGDGTCNNGESYTDENRNGSWNADIGVSGNGNANDVVIYTVTASYKPLLAIPFLPMFNKTKSMNATAVKKNQPFANQASYGSSAGTC